MARLLLSLQDTAHQLSVSVRTIRRLIDSQELPAVRVLGAIRIPAVSLEQWVESHTAISNNRACAGPDVRKGGSTCHLSAKTANTGGLLSSHQMVNELDALLEQRIARKQPHSKVSGEPRRT